jgi:formamidopyrimidine-DNA glycosylase
VPELPEVEALAGFLREKAVGRAVSRVDVAAVSALKTYRPPVTELVGHEVASVSRHGKFLDLEVGALHLVIHLARAGWLRWIEQLPAAPPRPGRGPLAVRVHLSGPGFDLTEAGTRKGLAVHVVAKAEDVPGVATLGIDPLVPGFDRAALEALLRGDRSQIKGVLRDQGRIAGIGNAYSDEILHAARLSPFKPAANLKPEELDRLYEAIRDVLAEAVARSGGLAAGDLKAEKRSGMRVHGRTGLPCPVCGDTVREISFADSSLQYCPNCQTGGTPLADRRLSRLLR